MNAARLSAVLTLVLIAGVAAAAGPAFNKPPRVVDSAGKVVGTLVYFNFGSGQSIVVRREGGTLVGFTVDENSLGGGGNSEFFHVSPDCSGTRYLQHPHFLGIRLVTPPISGMFYYPGDPTHHLFVRGHGELSHLPEQRGYSTPEWVLLSCLQLLRGRGCWAGGGLRPFHLYPAVQFEVAAAGHLLRMTLAAPSGRQRLGAAHPFEARAEGQADAGSGGRYSGHDYHDAKAPRRRQPQGK